MEKAKRYLVFLIGLFVNSLGVSLITKANLGTSPISSIPYVLSLNFPFTLGNFTIVFNLILIALQIIILRKNFKLEYLLQIPVTVLFGYFIDLTMYFLSFMDPSFYVMKLVSLLIGCIVLGFGVYLEVLANVVMLPGESLVRAISSTWHFEFGITKVCFDASLAIIAIAMSFGLAHKLMGVREGTIIAALLVGFIARQFNHALRGIEPKLFPQAEAEKKAAEAAMETAHYVIAIGRQYGSGGRKLGEALAQRLGFAFYDREIIKLTAGTTGLSTEWVRKKEESMTNSLLYDLVNQMYAYSSEYESPKDRVFQAETQVVRELAQKGDCVIVGRMADYILKDSPNCIRVFLHTEFDSRVRNVMERQHLSKSEAVDIIQKEEKRRADNYRYYTHQIWGFAGNYDISLDTDMGIDFFEKIIRYMMERK